MQQGAPPSLASRTASPLLPVGEPTGVVDKDAEDEADAKAIKSHNELVAEGNVVAAATIFSASVVLDALNALPTTLVVDVPVSMRTTALVLIALVASPAVRDDLRFQQRIVASVLLAIVAWFGLHQGGVNARIADAMYSLLSGWAVILIFGLTGPGVGQRGHDAKCRRENVIALSAGFLGYAGVRIVRAGMFHASEVAQFTASHGDITSRGLAMADDLVASTLVFGGTLCVCAAAIVLSNHEAIYEFGCNPICAVMGHISVLVFTAAFIVQITAFSKLDELGALFGDDACVGDANVCEASYRARRLYTSNSSAASLWCCAVGLVVFAFPYSRRCKTRRDHYATEGDEAAREAAAGSGYAAIVSAAVAVVVVYYHGDRANPLPSLELLLLYASIPVAWFGNTCIACALHTVGIGMYTVGRLGSVFGFDLAYLTHWFVGCSFLVVATLTVTTFISWALYASCCSRGKYVVWLDTLTALLTVAIVSMQMFLVIASLAIGSGYDGALIADTPSWRISSINWCTQHSISFFFAAALVGGRFEIHNGEVSSFVIRVVWFVVPTILSISWFLYLLFASANVPYTATGDSVSLGIAFAAAAVPWIVSGTVAC